MGGAGDLGLATLSCHTRAQIDPDTGEQSTSEEYVVRDTPLLVNIKGCGYPPDTMCDLFAEKYQNHSRAGETFPCHYSRLELETNLHEVCRCTITEPLTPGTSWGLFPDCETSKFAKVRFHLYSRYNPWMVISHYNRYRSQFTVSTITMQIYFQRRDSLRYNVLNFHPQHNFCCLCCHLGLLVLPLLRVPLQKSQ